MKIINRITLIKAINNSKTLETKIANKTIKLINKVKIIK